MRRTVICLICVVFMTGCYSAQMVAPQRSNIKVLSETGTTNFKKEIRLWYALWGLVPISETSSARVIKEHELTEVRVTTKFKFLDFLIGAFTSIASIVPQTMVIEGKSTLQDEEAAAVQNENDEPLPRHVDQLQAAGQKK